MPSISSEAGRPVEAGAVKRAGTAWNVADAVENSSKFGIGIGEYCPGILVNLNSPLHRRAAGDKSIGNETTTSSGPAANGRAFDGIDPWLRTLESGNVSPGEIPMDVLASQDFIAAAIGKCPGRIVEYFNSCNLEHIGSFANRYDGIADAAFASLFAKGLSADRIPGEVKNSPQFLGVAVAQNFDRTMVEIFGGKNPQWVNDAMASLPSKSIGALLGRTSSAGEFTGGTTKSVANSHRADSMGSGNVVKRESPGRSDSCGGRELIGD
jgi:hypothetical protein